MINMNKNNELKKLDKEWNNVLDKEKFIPLKEL